MERFKNCVLVLLGNIDIERIDRENHELREENKRLRNKIERLEEENRAFINRNSFRESAPYERRAVIFGRSSGSEPSVVNSVEENIIIIFKNLRSDFETFCDEYFGSKIIGDREFYREEARLYRMIYTSMETSNGIRCIKNDIMQQLSLDENRKDICAAELESLLKRIHENYGKIFHAPKKGGYPKYDLVFPEEGDYISSDYVVKGKGKKEKIDFCLYPGIRETQRNAKEEKSLFRAKPIIWSIEGSAR